MEELKKAFAQILAAAEAAHRSGASPGHLCAVQREAIDHILGASFQTALPDPDPRGVALVALGGFGRGELAPFSDLDILILHRGWRQDRLADLHRAFLYPLWDAGREVGHRSRTPEEMLVSLGETEEATAALDARLLYGDARLFEDMTVAVGRRLQRQRARFLRELRALTSERHRRHGHAGHLLEPNVRDSAGALRDLNCLHWVSRLHPAGADGDVLVEQGLIDRDDAALLGETRDLLMRVRFELHLRAGRRYDRFHLQDHDDVAKALGSLDVRGAPDPDSLLKTLYRLCREVEAILASVWEPLLRRRGRRGLRGSRTVGPGLVLLQDRLEVVGAPLPSDDASAWIRAFSAAARHRVPLARSAIARLRSALQVEKGCQWSSASLRAFVGLLEQGADAVGALESMDRSGLLAALIPGWEPLRASPQRDPYHRFTVDMHLFWAAAELAESRSLDEPAVRRAWDLVGDALPLQLAALLHDIGKGRGGDHVSAGAGIARDAVRCMGLAEPHVADVEFLVAEHLLLPDVATRRDLSDPAVVAAVVDRAGDVRRLSMLYLLARADALATGSQAWSPLRAALVTELFGNALKAMGGEGPELQTAAHRETPVAVTGLEPGEVRTALRPLDVADELYVVATDRPGLLATVSGALALRGLEVHSAEATTTEEGVAVQRFLVDDAGRDVGPERWRDVRATIVAAVQGSLDLDEALRRRASHLRVAPVEGEVEVTIDNSASELYTLVEVHCTDRLGLLRELAAVLSRQGCDIHQAKISTYGRKVIDVFYVKERQGGRIEEPGRLEALSAAVRAVLRS